MSAPPVKATRHWITSRRWDGDKADALDGTPVLWPTRYGPHDEEVFVIRASDLRALTHVVYTTIGSQRCCGLTNEAIATSVMDALGLVPTPPRRSRKAIKSR